MPQTLCVSFKKELGKIIGSPEKVAYKQGFINKERLQEQAEALKKSGYGLYLNY